MRVLVLILLSLYVSSCSTVEHTDNDEFSVITDACYEIVKDSFLYSLTYCESGADVCFGLQAYGIGEDHPSDESEIISNRDHWESKIDYLARVGGMKQSEFSGSVTSGTKMKVSYLSFGDKGTLGKLWRVEFLITSGVHANKLIVPPSPYHLLYPDWLE